MGRFSWKLRWEGNEESLSIVVEFLVVCGSTGSRSSVSSSSSSTSSSWNSNSKSG